jgi:hypothetical protein
LIKGEGKRQKAEGWEAGREKAKGERQRADGSISNQSCFGKKLTEII